MGTVFDVPPVSAAPIRLPDRYKVVRHIANGGMAGVWEAHDELLDRAVAVKVLAQHLSEDERARARFEREARAAAGLSSHPNVATIYDVGEHEGRAFIVMELMRGGSVADVLRRGDRIEHQRALRWLREAAAGLDAAHAAGIVHRDVKPANLLLDDRDRLGIGDFGIARLAWEEQVTQTGQVLGTAAYLAPEQAMGEPAIAASDRYALAVVAFELLTGEKPFQAEHFAAQARAHIEDDPPRVSELAPDLSERVDDVIDRGMAKDPDDRWATAEEFVERLGEALTPPPPKRGAAGTTATRKLDRTPPPPSRPARRGGRGRRPAEIGPGHRHAARRARRRAARARGRVPAAARRRRRRGQPHGGRQHADADGDGREEGDADAHRDAGGHAGADADRDARGGRPSRRPPRSPRAARANSSSRPSTSTTTASTSRRCRSRRRRSRRAARATRR